MSRLHLLRQLPSTYPSISTRAGQYRTIPSLAASIRFAHVQADQTKQNNSPNGETKAEHEKTTEQTGTAGSDQEHPAKQPDPQEPPSRSTGIETSGPDGNAKDGK